MIAQIIQAARLAAAIAHGDVTMERAARFSLAATLLCEEPSLCASIAIAESRLVPTAINPRTGTRGVMQTSNGPRELTTWAGVEAGVQRLADARAFCSWRGDETTTCRLVAYAAGPRGVRAMEAGARWPARRAHRVLTRAWVIQRRMGVLDAKGEHAHREAAI